MNAKEFCACGRKQSEEWLFQNFINLFKTYHKPFKTFAQIFWNEKEKKAQLIFLEIEQINNKLAFMACSN